MQSADDAVAANEWYGSCGFNQLSRAGLGVYIHRVSIYLICRFIHRIIIMIVPGCLTYMIAFAARGDGVTAFLSLSLLSATLLSFKPPIRLRSSRIAALQGSNPTHTHHTHPAETHALRDLVAGRGGGGLQAQK